jgi:flagellar biosynthetic protein FliQ
VSPDHALALIAGLLKVTLIVCGPLLAAALAGGLVVGVIQTATQINEASISFVVKCTAVILTLVLVGPYVTEKAVSYAREQITAVALVVR